MAIGNRSGCIRILSTLQYVALIQLPLIRPSYSSTQPGVPGVITPNSTINMINQFLDWAQVQPNVWIVTNIQLLEWVRNPVPISQLNSFAPFKCPVPQVNAQICNGIPADELGLVQECDFSDFPFSTCVSDLFRNRVTDSGY